VARKKSKKNQNWSLIIIVIALAIIIFLTFTPTGKFFDPTHDGDIPPAEIPQTIRIDTDGDGILNVDDVCPNDYDPGQMDFNNDGIGDKCQDSDGDGLTDYIELNAKFYPLTCTLDTSIQIIGTEPTLTDTDGDGISDPNDKYPLTGIPNNRVNSVAQNNYP
tara:strand:- start:67 stop:552 length:486 start_codon:yes stop_codon:yes gene_type:complete